MFCFKGFEGIADYPNARILIIDDNEDNLLCYKRFLTEAGYSHISLIQNPFEAESAFQEFKPDLMLVDYRMPPVDGIYVVERIRHQELESRYVPVIMVTSTSDAKVKDRALSTGINDYIQLEESWDELMIRIRNALRIAELHTHLRKENSILELMVKLRTEELTRAHEDVLTRLARAAEFRDDQTGGHASRVGIYSAKIARAMGLPRGFENDIRTAAPLHDLGKIGISDSLLQKQGPLTDKDYEALKRHSSIGESILRGSNCQIIELAREIAFTHHERWDGKGYPRGLSGLSIPLSGRIVAVADAFDAMTTDRCYCKATTEFNALKELRKCSGSQFDPTVVAAFEGAMNKPRVPRKSKMTFDGSCSFQVVQG